MPTSGPWKTCHIFSANDKLSNCQLKNEFVCLMDWATEVWSNNGSLRMWKNLKAATTAWPLLPMLVSNAVGQHPILQLGFVVLETLKQTACLGLRSWRSSPLPHVGGGLWQTPLSGVHVVWLEDRVPDCGATGLPLVGDWTSAQSQNKNQSQLVGTGKYFLDWTDKLNSAAQRTLSSHSLHHLRGNKQVFHRYKIYK